MNIYTLIFAELVMGSLLSGEAACLSCYTNAKKAVFTKKQLAKKER